MRVTDLAQAMAPEAQTEIVGIRPGEKLHELLLTADEARHSLDMGEVYVVLPESISWDKGVEWEGKSLDDGFTYNSGTNEWWLTPDELVGMLP